MYYFIFKTFLKLVSFIFLERWVAFDYVIKQHFILTLVLANDLKHTVFHIEK